MAIRSLLFVFTSVVFQMEIHGAELHGLSNIVVQGQNFTLICSFTTTPQIGILFKRKLTTDDKSYDYFSFSLTEGNCVGSESSGGVGPESCTTSDLCTCSDDRKMFTVYIPEDVINSSWHNSEWTCGGAISTPSSVLKLYVIVPFTKAEITPAGDLVTNVSSPVTAVCTSSPASYPEAEINWTLRITNGTLINITSSSTQVTDPISNDHNTDIVKTTRSKLTYIPTDKSYNGASIYCQASNNRMATQTSQERRLVVQYAPKGSIVTRNNITGELTEGMSVGLICQVSGGNPLASLFWSCKGQSMTSINKSTGTIARWELQIEVDRSYDSKSCVCTGTHPLWTSNSTITLSVYYPPRGTPLLTITPRKPYYLVNDSTALTCKSPSSSKPAATITWSCKGKDVTSSATNGTVGNIADSSLVIKVDSGFNEQLCVCTISHRVNNYRQSVSITFDVHYTPTENIVLTANPSKSYKGDNVSIACYIKGGNPLSNVTLFCGAAQGSDNSNADTSSRFIDLNNIDKDRNNQICVCTATHSDYAAFTPKMNLTLVVYYPPETPTIMPVTEKFPWLEEQIGQLSCSALSGNPAATDFQWTGRRISAGEGKGQSVSIGPLSYTDDKNEYQCQVSNKFTVDKGINVFGTVMLDVQYKPRIILNRNQATIRETETFTQYCNATGNPRPLLQWCHKSSLQCFKEQNPAILMFEKTQRNNTDIYICKAWSNSDKYGKLESNSTFTVTVNYAPDVNVTATNIPVEGVTDFAMSCSVQGVPSAYNFHKWQHYYDGILIRELTDDPVYRFRRPLSFEDSGIYTCIVDNGVTDGNGVLLQNNTFHLMVQFIPHFITEPITQVSGDDQAPLSVNVEFITFPNITYLMWNKADGNFSEPTILTTYQHPIVTTFYKKPVTIKNFGYQSWVNFSVFSTTDKGKYSLIVANVIGSANYSFKASFKGPPDIPTSLELLSVTVRSVNVSWISGENNGFNQIFHLGYRSKESHFFQNVTETKKKKKYGIVITSLQPQTLYTLELTVSNERGYNPGVLIRNFTTLKEVKSEPTSRAAVFGAGAAAGVVLAILVVLAVIFVIKRRKTVSKGDDTELVSRRNGNPEVDDPDEGMKPNIIYESAGPVNASQSGKTGEKYVYAEVNKPGGVVAKPNDVYAEVNKNEPPGVLYAEVQKPGKKKGKGVKENQKKGGKKEKHSGVKKETTGDVYENVSVIGDSTGDVYANSPEKQNKTPPKENLSRRKNKDGLVYIDVVIKNTAGNGGKKGVIHGIENRNDYAEVDFTRHADPLPSDDNEDDVTSDKTPEENNQE